MMSSRDPFYIVKDEIQDSIDKLRSVFQQWEKTTSDSEDFIHLNRELVASCESLEWQVDELDKAIAVAEKDLAHYQIDEVELEKRRRWIVTARDQVNAVMNAIKGAKTPIGTTKEISTDTRKEFMWIPDGRTLQGGRPNHYASQDSDDFLASESDQQMLLIKQQDEELDELSASIQRIGGVGLSIHDELVGQERIIEELSLDMGTTSNQLNFVQKKVNMVMKKAGAKGQIFMILLLIILFTVLLVLVFNA